MTNPPPRPCRRCGKKTRKDDTRIQTAPGEPIRRACLCELCARVANRIMAENQAQAKRRRIIANAQT